MKPRGVVAIARIAREYVRQALSEPTRSATRNGAACSAQTRRLDRTTRRLGSAAELAVSPGLAETRLKQSSPSAAALWHGGSPRLAKSRCPRLRDSRSRLPHPTASPFGQGAATLQVRPAGVWRGGPREARPSRAVTIQSWTDRRPPLGDGGRRSRAGAPLQQRERACVERKPCPDGII